MKPVRALTFGGLLAAIHVVITLLLHFDVVPGIELIITFAVPFFSAVYAYKNKIRDIAIFAVATLLICIPIDPSAGLLYILPTLAVGITYGELVKHRADGTTMVYVLTILEFGLFFLSAYLIEVIYSTDLISNLKTIFHLEKSSNAHLALGLLLAYSFIQAFLIHFIVKGQLKKIGVEFKKNEYPPFWVLILAIASLVASFMPYEDELYIIFTTVATIVFCLPIALYGYQATDKPQILLIIQAVSFLGGTIPLLKVYEGTHSAAPYLVLFAAPVFYAVYVLIMHTYPKQDNLKVKDKKGTNKKGKK